MRKRDTNAWAKMMPHEPIHHLLPIEEIATYLKAEDLPTTEELDGLERRLREQIKADRHDYAISTATMVQLIRAARKANK